MALRPVRPRGPPPPPWRPPRPAENCVPMIGTPEAEVRKALAMARVTADDVVLDVGCGTGRVCITAAAVFGATAHGLELYGPNLDAARRAAEEALVSDRCHFHSWDLNNVEEHPAWSQATVVYWWLLPCVAERLLPAFRRAAHRLRLVSYSPTNPCHFETDTLALAAGNDLATSAADCIAPARVDGALALFTEVPGFAADAAPAEMEGRAARATDASRAKK
eukprot:CAMPEP_0204596746 /NCGR_PEP_ID=MMETSP0661-20131031/53414_1 /ASSEMBLY_ACC=CAM_ASM_000606 /TAXON_ID=109239 /ORGANISM="Alexandrium margalefi, Strain AMGDE01CS-322" /LENGTH=220 /DNA_ID=CAMNT_0051607379 /DNA_START=32 /DNA_END=692 /DNA_ORIENTATION=-